MTIEDEAKRLAEFVQFLAACPREQEIKLQYDNVSTAFHQARAKGWTVDELAADAVSTFRRGGGVGAVVVRLNTMSTTQRVTRGPARGLQQPPPFVPQDVNRIPPSWARERVELLERCKTMTPDGAEDAMRELISEQQGRW